MREIPSDPSEFAVLCKIISEMKKDFADIEDMYRRESAPIPERLLDACPKEIREELECHGDYLDMKIWKAFVDFKNKWGI